MSRALTEQDFHQRYVVADDGCWLWTGPTVNSGYGAFAGRWLAHRWAYHHLVRPIPEGHQIDHLCSVKLCVNPEHLDAVTPRVNSRRWADQITTCPAGHPYEGDNLMIGVVYRGAKQYETRKCRTCHNARVAAYGRSRRAAARAQVEQG